MPPLLPTFADEKTFDTTQHTEAMYRSAIEEIGRRHDLPQGVVFRKYSGGSLVVFSWGETHAIKLYPPFGLHHFKNEVAFYRYLHGKLQLETPKIIAADTIEGWDYIVMSQLVDPLLEDQWQHIPPSQKRMLTHQLGQHISHLHSLPIGPLDFTCPNWAAFQTEQVKHAVVQQHKMGTDPFWVNQIEDYLEKWLPHLPLQFAPSLLHTEWAGSCLTVAQRDNGWHLSGLMDFADSFVGPREYDFASVFLLICGADYSLRQAFLEGYGLSQPDDQWPQRIMVYTLLHRYSNLSWYMAESMQPPAAHTQSFEDLAQQWYGIPPSTTPL